MKLEQAQDKIRVALELVEEYLEKQLRTPEDDRDRLRKATLHLRLSQSLIELQKIVGYEEKPTRWARFVEGMRSGWRAGRGPRARR